MKIRSMNSGGCARIAAVFATVTGACAGASAQSTLYNNCRFAPNDYGVVTGTVTASGVVSPSGAAWSELPSDAAGVNAIAGFAGGLTEPAGGFRFADDFTVPTTTRWRIDKIVFFAYHVRMPNSPLLGFDNVNVRIAYGAPTDAETRTVWGDAFTNRFTSATPTNCYRVLNSAAVPFPVAPDFSRNVFRIEVATPGLSLSPGTYWLDWQFADNVPVAEVFVPPVTHPGMRGIVGGNAMQFRPLSLAGGGSWLALNDTGKPSAAADVPQDLPFILVGQPLCISDLNLDGEVDLADFFLFLEGFDRTLPVADVNTDGLVDLVDFFLFLERFDVSC